MKKTNPSFISLFVAVSLICFCLSGSKAQDLSDPSVYLSTINEEFMKMSKDMMSYISAANHGKSARKVEKRRSELSNQAKESERAIRQLKPFEGSARLRDSIALYFKICHLVINEDYGKIVDLEEIAEQSYDDMEAYLLAKERAGERIHKAFESGQAEYRGFAASHNIRLIETDSKLSQRLKEAGEVNQYHDKIYLLFFKSFKNEAYLLDALNQGNLGALEQTRNALLASASEDLINLGAIGTFNGDGTLKKVSQDLLRFYEVEAKDKIPLVIDYFLAKENFEKVKKALDSKKQADRTQADIDNFNAAVSAFNSTVNQSNQTNEDLNRKRSALLKAWNEASNSFLDKYTPK